MIAAGPRKLRLDRRGTAGVELALTLPIVTMLLFAGVDLARGFAAKLDLEQAAGRTIELATAPGVVRSDYSFLQTEAMLASGQPAANVTVSNWLECNAVANASFSATCTAGQQTARYVSVTITRSYVPTFRWMGLAVGGSSNGAVAINGDAVVRVQ